MARRVMQQRCFDTAQGSKSAAWRKRRGRGLLLGVALATLLLVALACAGGAPTAAPAPQQPAQPAPSAPAAPAAEPQPATRPGAPVAIAPAPVRPTAPVAPAAPAKEPKYGGVLRLAHRADPAAGGDLMRSTSISTSHVSGSLNGVGNFVRSCRGDVYKACTGIAESWEPSPDFTQWTFKVRDNIRWHDGKPFTAEDAKWWVELVAFGAKGGGKTRLPAIFSDIFQGLTKAEALPGNRVRLVFEKPTHHLLTFLAMPTSQIAHPRHLMQPRIAQGEVNTAPSDVGWVSIGPYKMKEYQRGTRVEVRRFDDFWEKDEKGRQLPYLEGIDFAIMRDQAAMDAAFRVGRLDGGARGFPHDLTKERRVGYVRDLGDQVWFWETMGNRQGWILNAIKPGPLQDVRVRKAFSLWLDRKAAIDAIVGGPDFASPVTLLDPQNPFTSPDFMTWPGWNAATRERDRTEAKRLLTEAGYAKGFKANILCRRLWLDRCEFIHGQATSLGVDLQILVMDDAAWNEARFTLEHDTKAGGIGVGHLIPETTEADATRHSVNRFSMLMHEDPKVVEFYDRLRAVSTSLDQRVKVLRELERYLFVDQVYFIPIFTQKLLTAYRTYVKGVVVPQEDFKNDTDFATVWLDK